MHFLQVLEEIEKIHFILNIEKNYTKSIFFHERNNDS
jgi:hypothetical protein